MAAAGVVDGGNSSSCDFETNWRVAAGSLKRTVVFESSSEDSPRAASSPDSVYDAATSLVLKPEGADSGPCEIKIRFLLKQEICQIYVRSTACVYEVYYAKSWQSDNEYLCTVRCNIAERDYQVLQAFDIKDSSESTENSSEELKEEKLAEGNIGTSEDDWVEVKVLDSTHENNMNSLSNKKNASMGRDIQYFYEATAEISDSDPCTSVTLRFLSLRNKSCLCVDEVYVFTDPVSAIDSDDQLLDVKGSAGSSLMALLVPTLLQLSKSGMSQIQGHQASSDLQNRSKIETQSKTTDSTDLTSHQNEKGSDDQQYMKAQQVDGSTTEPAETHLCNRILNGNKSDKLLVKDDSGYSHLEKVLEQLVSRVGRIEEVCLRFEENMLKPLHSMEMRIQRVEQKLEELNNSQHSGCPPCMRFSAPSFSCNSGSFHNEELVNNSQHSGFPPCMRFSAPSFSCNSNSSSFHNDGFDYQPCRAPESEKKEMTSVDLFNGSDGIPSSANVPHCLPSLVVTAPDFCCEDNLDDDGTKSPIISPQKSQKKLSIDDILAASLSRFLSASTDNLSECKRTAFISHATSEITSGKVLAENVPALNNGVEITSDVNAKEEPSRYTQVLTVMAPEFTSEEIANEECLNYAEFASVVFPKFPSKIGERGNDVTSKATEDGCAVVPSDLSDINRDGLVSDFASIPSTVISPVFADVDGEISDDVPPGVADAQNHVPERNNACCFIVRSIDDKVDEAEDIIRNVCQTITGSDHIEPVNSLIPEKEDVFEQVSGNETDGNHITVSAGSGAECVAAESPDEEILRNISDLSNASLVDFGIPILDVKFTPYEDSRTQLPLEALLDDVINHNVEADIPQEIGVQVAYAQEINVIDIHEEDETEDSLAGSTSPVIEQGTYDMTLSSTEESAFDDSYLSCKQENVASLI